jgi:pimeloyl-ACP methyl ester carboxylesterase
MLTEFSQIGAEGRTTTVGKLTLFHVEMGAGPIVVLLHGWPQTSWAWRKVMPLLSTRYRVIAIDTPGLGGSEPPTNGYDKRSLARDIHGLLESYGHDEINLVGHDLGAAIAYAYARQYPNAVRRLAVMDDPIPGLADWEAVKGQWPRWHFAFNALPNLPEALVAGRELTYLGWFYNNAFQKDAIGDQDARLYARAYARASALHAGFEYYRAFDQDAADNRADEGRLDMPVLALGGDHSPWRTYLRDQLKDRASTIEGDVVPECGHFIPEEQPEWLARRLMRFIG